MIKCNQGNLQIEGTRPELIFDINQIIESMYNHHPEMMLSVMASWADKLIGVDIDTLNKDLIDYFDGVQADLIKFLKENREDGI